MTCTASKNHPFRTRLARLRLSPAGSAARTLLLAACLLGLLPARPSGAAAPEPLVLNTSASAPRSLPDGAGFEDRIILEAFRRIGVPVQIVHQPAERALHNADAGILDGDCWRVGGLAAQYPNLVMVPEPVDDVAIQVFTRDQAMAITGWADLRPYNVAYINGWKILDAHVKATRSVEKVRNIEALFALLDKNRTDAVLVDPVLGQETVRRMQLSGVRVLKPALTRQDMHIYLHKRHAELVPQLALALRQMKRDGTFQRLTKTGPGGETQ